MPAKKPVSVAKKEQGSLNHQVAKPRDGGLDQRLFKDAGSDEYSPEGFNELEVLHQMLTKLRGKAWDAYDGIVAGKVSTTDLLYFRRAAWEYRRKIKYPVGTVTDRKNAAKREAARLRGYLCHVDGLYSALKEATRHRDWKLSAVNTLWEPMLRVQDGLDDMVRYFEHMANDMGIYAWLPIDPLASLMQDLLYGLGLRDSHARAIAEIIHEWTTGSFPKRGGSGRWEAAEQAIKRLKQARNKRSRRSGIGTETVPTLTPTTNIAQTQ
jgi:hypothetical protein